MILSHKLKFIFFSNGKTGTTSIEQRLGHLHEERGHAFSVKGLFIEKHIPPVLLRACLPEHLWRDYFKFVFVRNPLDWCVSQWNYNFNYKFRTLPDTHPAKRAVTGADPALPGPTIMGRKLAELASTRIFLPSDVEFLFEFLKRTYRVVPYADGSYQSSFIQDRDGNQIVDFIGKFENLQRDYQAVAARLGLDPALPHLNRTSSGDYRSYYTEDAAAMVARLWAVDFRTLGYPTALNA